MLRDALKQAINKLDYYKNLADRADAAIEGLKKNVGDAKSVIAADARERAAMQSVIDNAETVIVNLQNEKAELKTQITIYEKLKANLEKRLRREKQKTSLYKKLALFGTAAGVVFGVILANKVN